MKMNKFLTYSGLLLALCVVCASGASANQKAKKVVLGKYGSHNYRDHLSQQCGPEDGHDLRKEVRDFLPINHGAADGSVTFSSRESIHSFYEVFRNQCSNDSAIAKLNRNWYKMQWRYKLYESLHCLRVELDLGNITRFKNIFNYTYYTFSYRELGKRNTFLKRQPIEESVNRLIIRHANLRPYIICISFYKDDLYKYDTVKSDDANSTNSTQEETTTAQPVLSCEERRNMLMQDVPAHDISMCVDIDTPEHFLEANKHSLEHRGITPELIMVLFIVGLLIFMLFAISIINFILVEKPLDKKRKRLRQFIARKLNNSADHSATLINSRDSLSRNNSKLQLSAAKEGCPAIVLSDFSSNKSLPISNTGSQGNEEPKETDGLLSSAAKAEGATTNGAASSHLSSDPFSATTSAKAGHDGHKVTFHIGETIMEEPAQLDPAAAEAEKSNEQQNEPNDESLKSVSHLLDDKPWLSSSNLNSGIQARQARSNSFVVTPVNEVKEAKKSMPN